MMARVRIDTAHASCGLRDVCRVSVAAPAAIRVQRARAIAHIAARLRSDTPRRLGGRLDAWTDDDATTRDEMARRLLFVRWRLNRAGLLRWRNERRGGAS